MSTSSPAGSDVPVLVIGEALIDAVNPLSGERAEHVGGSPANVAFGLGALGHDVTLATWFGQDERGSRITEACERHGVKVAAGSDAADHTSVAQANLDASGAATYDFDLQWVVPDIPADEHYGHLHAGSIAAVLEPGSEAVRDLIERRRGGATVSYDPNARPTIMGHPDDAVEVVRQVIALADVVKMSDEDVAWLFPELGVDGVVGGFGPHGPSLVIVTRGSDGVSYGLPRSGTRGHAPARDVDVVDTVGAGDSFMAGLISGLLDEGLLGGTEARGRLKDADEKTVLPALRRALMTGSLTVARAGAFAPTRADLHDAEA